MHLLIEIYPVVSLDRLRLDLSENVDHMRPVYQILLTHESEPDVGE
jgi:hypothetical protein